MIQKSSLFNLKPYSQTGVKGKQWNFYDRTPDNGTGF